MASTGSAGAYPLQVLPEVCEELQPPEQNILLPFSQIVLLILLWGNQRLIEIGFPLQFPVLVKEFHRLLRQPQHFGHFQRLNKRVELVLQLLELLLAEADPVGLLLVLIHGVEGIHVGRKGAVLYPIPVLLTWAFTQSLSVRFLGGAVLGTVGLELHLVVLCQDGFHLQAAIKRAGDMKGCSAVFH